MIDIRPGEFITILIFSFALFLLITGAFTAYFGSGKSRKIGAGLLAGGLVIGIIWAYLEWQQKSALGEFLSVNDLGNLIVGSIYVLIAALVGAGLAIGLFLLTIMKS
ncbi:MAG: hypothetical protein LN416_09660 [Candidatus Thermoplasmatota archaeon]|nr:hypothetical protein [Candidatus Thermoplasmatota archaeon]